MAIVRRNNQPVSASYRPLQEADEFGRLIENLFGEFLAPYSSLARLDQDAAISPRINVTETEKSFEIDVEVPGVTKENVKVAIDNRRVTIEAEANKEEKKEGDNIIYAERLLRKFSRSFGLPSDVDDSTAQAKLENGILHLSLPKRDVENVKKITVQ